MNVLGIHHVTAVSAKISDNLQFYTGTLGLRLVKKSVNQDDVKAYHLFYADKVATPGTDVTFFDWPNMPDAIPGPGTVALISLKIGSMEALDWWEDRLEKAGIVTERNVDPRGRDCLHFSDEEGQRLELIVEPAFSEQVQPWTATVREEMAIGGILGVDLESLRPPATMRVLREILGFEVVHQEGVAVMEVRTDSSLVEIRLIQPTSQRPGRVGAGGVHHVAFLVKDDDELLAFQKKIEGMGLQTSGFVNRFYFHSLYFREPGGILFELATEGPGMAVDEDASSLGQKLALPPFLEPQREEIERNLKPLPPPAYVLFSEGSGL